MDEKYRQQLLSIKTQLQTFPEEVGVGEVLKALEVVLGANVDTPSPLEELSIAHSNAVSDVESAKIAYDNAVTLEKKALEALAAENDKYVNSQSVFDK